MRLMIWINADRGSETPCIVRSINIVYVYPYNHLLSHLSITDPLHSAVYFELFWYVPKSDFNFVIVSFPQILVQHIFNF